MILTSTDTYNAEKVSCGKVVDNWDEYKSLDFYDPADGLLTPCRNSRDWFGDQRRNKVVWMLDVVFMTEIKFKKGEYQL